MTDIPLPPGVVPIEKEQPPALPPGVVPIETKQEEPARPGVGERTWAHVQEGFDATLAGAATAGILAGGVETAEIRRLQNQLKMYEGRPGWLGGPDQQRIASIKAKIDELTGIREKKLADTQASRAARKTAYEAMPKAEGVLENTAAVAGHVIGALASPETLLGGTALGGAKAVVKSAAPLVEKVGAVAGEALRGGRNMMGVEAPANILSQTIKTESQLQDKFSLEELATHTAAAGVGGTVFTAIFGAFAKPLIQRPLTPAEHAVKANLAEQGHRVGDEVTQSLAEMARQKIWNWWDPLIRIQKEAGLGKTVLGRPTEELLKKDVKLYPTDEAALLRGTSSQIKVALEDGMFMPNEFGNEFVKTSDDSLLKILKELGPNANSFLQYVAALRSSYVEEVRGIKTGFDRARNNVIIDEFTPKGANSVREWVMNLVDENKNKLYTTEEAITAKVAESMATREQMNVMLGRYKEWTDWILDYKKKHGGLYSLDEQYKILQDNPAFIPFYHIDPFSGEVKAIVSAGKDKKLKGSNFTVNNLAENLVNYTARSLEAANKNHFRQSIYDMIDTMPGGERYATRKADAFKMTADDIRADLMADSHISDDIKNLLPTMPMADLRSIYFRKTLKGNEDVVYRNGEAHVYTIHDAGLIETLKQLTPKQLGIAKFNIAELTKRMPDFGSDKVRNFLDKTPEWGLPEIKSTFTAMVTHNPAFAMGTNLLRDAQAAFVNGKHAHIPIYSQIKSVGQMMWSDKDLVKFNMNGGGYAGLSSIERTTNINKMYKDAGVNFKEDVLNDVGAIKLAVRKFMTTMEQFELASRVAESKKLTEAGAPGRIAALAGREITVDFGGEGSSQFIKNMNAIIPFFKPVLNAQRRLGRRFDADNIAQTVARGNAIMVATASAYMWNQQPWAKEHYDNLPEWLKASHLTFAYPKYSEEKGLTFGGFWHLPYEQGIGYAFGSIPRAIIEADTKGDYNVLAKALRTYFLTTFNVMEMPPLWGMLHDVGGAVGAVKPEEVKRFTGAPVIPRDQQSLAPIAQYDPQTSSYMIELGEQLGMSPKLIENAFKSMGLYLAEAALTAGEHLTDKRKDMGRGNLPATSWDDTWFAGRFIKDAPPKYGPADEEFYKLSKMVNTEASTLKLGETRLDFKRTYDVLRKNNPRYGEMATLTPTIAEIQENIKQLDNAIELTWSIPMDPKLKREKLNQYTWERTMIMSTAIEQLVNKVPVIKDKLRPQGVGPFLKTLWTGSPTGYAEGGLVKNNILKGLK